MSSTCAKYCRVMEMKRICVQTAAALLAAVLLLPVDVCAVSAKSAILMDAQTGRVLYEKNADHRSLIASTTKIMTALIVCEQCNVLDRMRIPKEAVGIEGSSMYLKEGETLSLQELLFGLMLHSGNDAAVALAIYCGGTVEGFVALMNDKARLLGLSDTHFVNPNGLDHPEHYSSARDLAVLTAYAMENPIFQKTVSTKTLTIGNRSMKNHNKLLWMIDGADGVKTGFTRAAGRVLVSSANRDGRRLVAVTIRDPNDWQDHQKLLEEGFRNYTQRQVVSAGQQVGIRYVFNGVEDSVPILAAENFYYPLMNNEEVNVVLANPEFSFAPVTAGGHAGFAYICIGDNAVGKVATVYGHTVEVKPPEKHGFWEGLFGGNKK